MVNLLVQIYAFCGQFKRLERKYSPRDLFPKKYSQKYSPIWILGFFVKGNEIKFYSSVSFRLI